MALSLQNFKYVTILSRNTQYSNFQANYKIKKFEITNGYLLLKSKTDV